MRRFLILLAVVTILGYGAFEARKLIAGPEIIILSPKDGSATSSSMVAIEGVAQNISFLTINDRAAFTDEAGHFTQILSPPPGYAVFTVKATDRFGRRASAQVRISVLNFCPIVQG
jgi:hypothetical protein